MGDEEKEEKKDEKDDRDTDTGRRRTHPDSKLAGHVVGSSMDE